MVQKTGEEAGEKALIFHEYLNLENFKRLQAESLQRQSKAYINIQFCDLISDLTPYKANSKGACQRNLAEKPFRSKLGSLLKTV